MKDQQESIKKELIEATRSQVLSLEKAGLTRAKVAEKMEVPRPFLSNFMGENWEGINGLAIPRLIKMANALGLKIEMTIKKKN